MSKKRYSATEKFSQPIEFITLVSRAGGEPLTSSAATRILLEIINEDEYPENDTPVEADARRRYRARNPSREDIDMIVEAEFVEPSR
jgi:hypothetical protein